eukprot:CAMPEP_0204583166 /NCGR_PEP_ID=MMETSP0661-20131031/45622_1 /ASSEMBLY_ACC=CAM_ASM_000606 /TAXON_ID=109239 /ORGANISM="Alexandrium margalefi, Strain AMGDE01CS-322" /LENGTH=159 /DNA_ID=CAMNT_0051592499 /DNA_START=49 /DNA_END=528 /DNA_ORIENTATION=+
MGAACCPERSFGQDEIVVGSNAARRKTRFDTAPSIPCGTESAAEEAIIQDARLAAGSGRDMLLTFCKPGGGTLEVRVDRKPLGARFDQDMPLRVAHVWPDGVFGELQIGLEWTVTKVNGECIDNLPFEEAFAVFNKGLAAVPEPKALGGRGGRVVEAIE